ncbi:TPA: hypothetical protein N0F65_007259 [Lagenidium giganteum]|uniref:Uncharacterized protein n=1 Tax=Lagenidium giganteum TaxID=4803 RepID=A0AAV2YWY5_9STRA|nr:TPA: hypothetical protein N0F65_007259 [Lagenidium giganteum]
MNLTGTIAGSFIQR